MKVITTVGSGKDLLPGTPQMQAPPSGSVPEQRASAVSASTVPPQQENLEKSEAYLNSGPRDTQVHGVPASFDAYPKDQSLLGLPNPRLQSDYVKFPLDEERCDLLPNYTAVWQVKGGGLKISSLAATVLIGEGVLDLKDLKLLRSQTYDVNQGPPDPISAILAATHRTVVGVLSGVVDYPVEISKMVMEDKSLAKGKAVEFALDNERGISRIIGTGLRAPMDFTLGISQGFHNTPILYGDKTVRPVENVTGFQSGIKAAGKNFGLGLYDGISGLITQPIQGAQANGAIGFLGGFWRGIGGAVCKPVAGAAGLPGYALKGIYEEIRKHRGSNLEGYALRRHNFQGQLEPESCTQVERNEILMSWYSFQLSREAMSGRV